MKTFLATTGYFVFFTLLDITVLHLCNGPVCSFVTGLMLWILLTMQQEEKKIWYHFLLYFLWWYPTMTLYFLPPALVTTVYLGVWFITFLIRHYLLYTPLLFSFFWSALYYTLLCFFLKTNLCLIDIAITFLIIVPVRRSLRKNVR